MRWVRMMEIIQRGYRKWKRRRGGEKKKHRKIQNDRAKPRSGQKMKERWKSRVRKYGGRKEGWKDWNKVRQREKGGRERDGIGGCLCLGVTFSAGCGLKGNNGGKDGGMARMKGWGGGGRAGEEEKDKKEKKNRQVVRLKKAETVKKPLSGKKKGTAEQHQWKRTGGSGSSDEAAQLQLLLNRSTALNPPLTQQHTHSQASTHTHTREDKVCIDVSGKTTTYPHPAATDWDYEGGNGTLGAHLLQSHTRGEKDSLNEGLAEKHCVCLGDLSCTHRSLLQHVAQIDMSH